VLLAGCGGGGSSTTEPGANVDWPHWGNVAENTHFADLDQVDRGNVTRLRVAWSRAEGPGQYAWETFPIVVGRTMYYDTGTDRVYAVDAAYDASTGKQLWRTFMVPPPGGGKRRADGSYGGGDVWMPPVVDPHSGIAYVSTGNRPPASPTPGAAAATRSPTPPSPSTRRPAGSSGATPRSARTPGTTTPCRRRRSST
jgi:hypothetical protein